MEREPLDDQELARVLRQWEAPRAPASLRGRLRQAVRPPRWRWWLTGTIRVPVPVGVAVFVLMALLAYGRLPGAGSERAAPSVTLADFVPVSSFEPVLVGVQR
jgi:hypothetical protein